MTECYECSRLAELVAQNTALKVERDQWREAAGNAHDMWEKAATERDEWKAKAEQVQESYLDAKSDRDAWKAKAESYMSDTADQENPRSQEADSAEPASLEAKNLAGREKPVGTLGRLADANDALAPENGVSAEDVDSNDANADSREKLEADVREWCGDIRWGYETIFKWLDRQAAITERDAFLRGRASLDDEFAELEAENARLEKRFEEFHHVWEVANKGWADAIAEAEKWRDKYRWLSAKCKVALG